MLDRSRPEHHRCNRAHRKRSSSRRPPLVPSKRQDGPEVHFERKVGASSAVLYDDPKEGIEALACYKPALSVQLRIWVTVASVSLTPRFHLWSWSKFDDGAVGTSAWHARP